MNTLNKNLKLVKSLLHSKNRDATDLFLVEGLRFVSEIPNWVDIKFYVISESFSQKNFNFRENIEKIVFTDKAFNSISNTVTPQGIIAVCQKIVWSIEDAFASSNSCLYLVLEDIKDPGNLGTTIRAAEAFNTRAIFLTKNAVDLYNPKVLRATMGAVFRIPVFQSFSITGIVDEFKSRGVSIYGASCDAEVFCLDEDFTDNIAVIVGSEAFGLSLTAIKSCDKLIKVPMEGNAESLNAAVAASVIMYEALRQRIYLKKNTSKNKIQ